MLTIFSSRRCLSHPIPPLPGLRHETKINCNHHIVIASVVFPFFFFFVPALYKTVRAETINSNFCLKEIIPSPQKFKNKLFPKSWL